MEKQGLKLKAVFQNAHLVPMPIDYVLLVRDFFNGSTHRKHKDFLYLFFINIAQGNSIGADGFIFSVCVEVMLAPAKNMMLPVRCHNNTHQRLTDSEMGARCFELVLLHPSTRRIQSKKSNSVPFYSKPRYR